MRQILTTESMTGPSSLVVSAGATSPRLCLVGFLFLFLHFKQYQTV